MSRTKHHGRKAKQRAYGDDWRWLHGSPGWWVHLMMTRPQRRAAAVWQRNAEKCPVQALEAMDGPPHGRRPQRYFW